MLEDNYVLIRYSPDNEWKARYVARLAEQRGLTVYMEEHRNERGVFSVTYRNVTVYDLRSVLYILF